MGPSIERCRRRDVLYWSGTFKNTQGCSSVGRVLVSKTSCRGFESCRPCQILKPLIRESNFPTHLIIEHKRIAATFRFSVGRSPIKNTV